MKDRVLLFELKERTSASGNRYLSGCPARTTAITLPGRASNAASILRCLRVSGLSPQRCGNASGDNKQEAP